MTFNQNGGGKIPGKTQYAGRRRPMTRKSGFSVHENTTGGEFRRVQVPIYKLQPFEEITVVFRMSEHYVGDLLGYGIWLWYTSGTDVEVVYSSLPDSGKFKDTFTQYPADSWNKIGSIWSATDTSPIEIILKLRAEGQPSQIAIYEPTCGRVRHKHLDNARDALLKNMFEFSPEALFLDGEIQAEVVIPEIEQNGQHELILKSCNRCGRYLPINVPMERNQLSFTNHCVATHRRPCKHATFGWLRNIDDKEDRLKLDYGFQLECRFCKKFEVNAAHNCQRSSAQMKEDGARRRAFEFLLAELYQGTPQLQYRHKNNSELADDIWNSFDRHCFACNAPLKTVRSMNLDHTRPLAFLWPLDGTATALCKSCNSNKRDRSPGTFYNSEQLERLSTITKVPLAELSSNKPNDVAIGLLVERLDWFFDDFLTRVEMIKERDGKVSGELVVKALQKVLASSSNYKYIDLVAEYERRRKIA
jgi:hypothetical protein